MSVYVPAIDAEFVHVPKTGGFWVCAALGLDVNEDARHHPSSTSRAFAFVRHPLSWLESWFRFGKWNEADYESPLLKDAGWYVLRPILCRCRASTFDGFVRKVLDREPGFVGRMYDYLLGMRGNPLVQVVGRWENLRADLAAILAGFGVRTTLPAGRVNVSSGPPVEWNAALRREVLTAEKYAIGRWYQDDRVITTEDL